MKAAKNKDQNNNEKSVVRKEEVQNTIEDGVADSTGDAEGAIDIKGYSVSKMQSDEFMHTNHSRNEFIRFLDAIKVSKCRYRSCGRCLCFATCRHITENGSHGTNKYFTAGMFLGLKGSTFEERRNHVFNVFLPKHIKMLQATGRAKQESVSGCDVFIFKPIVISSKCLCYDEETGDCFENGDELFEKNRDDGLNTDVEVKNKEKDLEASVNDDNIAKIIDSLSEVKQSLNKLGRIDDNSLVAAVKSRSNSTILEEVVDAIGELGTQLNQMQERQDSMEEAIAQLTKNNQAVKLYLKAYNDLYKAKVPAKSKEEFGEDNDTLDDKVSRNLQNFKGMKDELRITKEQLAQKNRQISWLQDNFRDLMLKNKLLKEGGQGEHHATNTYKYRPKDEPNANKYRPSDNTQLDYRQ